MCHLGKSSNLSLDNGQSKAGFQIHIGSVFKKLLDPYQEPKSGYGWGSGYMFTKKSLYLFPFLLSRYWGGMWWHSSSAYTQSTSSHIRALMVMTNEKEGGEGVLS